MLLQSLWLTNRSLIDQMSEYEYKCKEKEIIESLFGGTRNMIEIMLKHKNNLSYIQQNKLLKILKKSTPTQNDDEKQSDLDQSVFNNKQTAIRFSDLDENCLSCIFIFLKPKERKIFAGTSRMICVASKHKKCYPNSEILPFPFHKSYHFMQKISEISILDNNKNNLSKLMHETELLYSWIKNEICTDARHSNPLRPYNILKTIGESGLLSILSNFLIDKNIIGHQIKFIANILQLFIEFTKLTCLETFIVNVNIIENLAFLMKHVMQKKDDIQT
eukprot:481507_1